jgi:hypothetical protein
MPKTIGVIVCLSLLVAACTAAETPTPTPAEPTEAQAFTGYPLSLDRGELFTGSGVCTGCHTFMKDQSGADVSIDKSWSAGLMANSSKDPYHIATVRSEVLHAPALREVVEGKCASCHTPMAVQSAIAAGEKTLLLDEGFLGADHTLHSLAMDGISCSLCHQVEQDNFGEAGSFGGGYLVDFELATGERLSYGPYEVEPQNVTAMKAASGFIPQQSAHMAAAELCGTCHNLVTPYLDAAGQVAGEFPEQAVYSEWLNSDYKDTQSCIDCHMPAAQGGVQLSITGGPLRAPFSQHIFAGGNAFMLNLLHKNGEQLGISSHPDNLEQAIRAAEEIIGNQSARLSLENFTLQGSALHGEVVITSLTGHKFPSGYPSRRAWLHITVRDADGAVAFESGAVDESGRIAGNDNDDDPARYEPHYPSLASPDQVQIYETILLDTDGSVTTKLLRAAVYVKDNRLLPLGFDKQNATSDTMVFGQATEDADFSAGGDRLELALELGEAQGPFTVQVELLYQSIGARWAQNLMSEESAESQAFTRYYASVPNLPLAAARAELVVEE